VADDAMMAKVAHTDSEALLRSEIALFKFYWKQTEHVVPVESIICATCCNDSVTLHTVDATYPDIRRTLASMEALGERGFLRIHLNTVLNMAYYRSRDADRFIKLSHPIGVPLKVSERCLPALHRFLNTCCY
jgi:DNA-binding LytR/AlgR family response regulator